ncbi:MAG: DNA topoisomerase I [Candidatus Magasanikbacteria bacterium RIFOXYC2_FULL_40_16]|uniref:DNA topoisomerase 1 n=3 Tax=Candidatus Magasanikiibacteriota TaxID=1752731 RepID=A0A1F6NHA1_9BACT|nr:MAG: DNA topoisomerase I [Candidatus Magasanikbacteria bacterium RIFOXYA2_FULL_40_20]OGH83249.1 MAG: DNA topoisomerase I [Candidatus Magasanikbacteria bacterium RIFOXYB1_FULL_40_15]OGH86459.1 MAG: DNA topoisomerase I [Candidatus Magasanikbacteria bacterium RIFOXYB2_FULL_40_13]OGH87054.1 MAG: DNA topoisomerase I [Candidatus Magasanikbacteria bacterium RIFOXYA1_FULL_40_8]OGH89532.1 MAG: DNA topoisomerase I [Candidatus Magasanikbacteria bacterium RIFOXYC2_FULL_40_16]
MANKLVIVESPTKAKTITKFLGNGFKVESSFGHVRDLPKSSMGINIEDGTFEPMYEIPSGKKKKVAELKKLAKDADEILFATDEDREGEAISWHLAELLKIKPEKVKRLVFHEITKTAIEDAIKNPRGLDINLVDAQQARRVLDRLVGYELSPLLWKKVRYGLSAGRVQSVAVHLIVEKELERAKFKSSEYFDLLAILSSSNEKFEAKLTEYETKPIPAGKDFDSDNGKLKKPENFILLGEKQAKELAEKLLTSKPWTISEISEKPYQTHPYPPFITSTLQQEAHRKLGWSAKQTMRTAQSLYENGYITYMRTDSVSLSSQAINAAREAAAEFGKEYVSEEIKNYQSKSKLAQEAHEAIRPAGSIFKHPSQVQKEVDGGESALYDLIWKRTVASQMKSAQMISLNVKIEVEKAIFEAKGKKIEFAGYLRAYVEGSDDPEAQLENQEITLPNLKEKQVVEAQSVKPDGHITQPPARYTEASLIKKLESEGVGRPSTYATILDTIVERDYVIKINNALIPTYTAMIVDYYLQKYFDNLVNVNFTSKMEDDLDKIAIGKEKWHPYIKEFYKEKFHSHIEKASQDETYPDIVVGKDKNTNQEIIIRSGKYGPYLQRGAGGENNTCSLSDSLAPADLNIESAMELLSKPSGPQVIYTDEATGKDITQRTGRFGPYLQLGEDDEKKKAKKVSLTYGPKKLPIGASVNIDNINAEQAKKIISFPLNIGEIDGGKITASVGRFGPYLKKGEDYRSIPKDKDILTITLEEAKELYAQEKKTRTRKKASILKELGEDPKTKKSIQVLDGPYGPYISNGTRTFAPIPKDTQPEEMTLELALRLIEEKKAKKKKKK